MAKATGETAGPPRGKLRLVTHKRPLGRHALHERTAERLRLKIIHGELAPGAPLAEAPLCGQFGVSRTPLREALKLLAAEGLVELWPNRSARVQPLRRSEISQLFETVSGIERIAAEHAATRMTPTDIARLATLQNRMERAHAERDRDLYFKLNQKIHLTIVAGAKNEVLASTHEVLLQRAERGRYLALYSQERWDESIAEHRRIQTALGQRDAESAGRLLAEHVLRTGTVVVAAVTAQAAGGTSRLD